MQVKPKMATEIPASITTPDQVETRLAAKGCIRAYLLVKPANLDVIEYYQSLGWEVLTVTPIAKNLY